MRTLLCILFLFMSIPFSQAQNKQESEIGRNTVFVEALGSGLFGSVNYEYQLTKTPGVSIRAGLGLYAEDDVYFTLPVSLQYAFPLWKQNYLEAGVGHTFAQEFNYSGYEPADGSTVVRNKFHNLFLNTAFKRHFGNNWMWKLQLSLVVNDDVSMIYPGLAFGKTF